MNIELRRRPAGATLAKVAVTAVTCLVSSYSPPAAAQTTDVEATPLNEPSAAEPSGTSASEEQDALTATVPPPETDRPIPPSTAVEMAPVEASHPITAPSTVASAAVGPQSATSGPAAAPWSVWGGFLSHELANPGFHLGVEYALETTRHFQTLATASIQMYDQPDTETAWSLQARWGHRYTSALGITFDHFLGLGAQYTQYDITVFEFTSGRGVPTTRTDTVLGFQFNLMFGPGFDLQRVVGVPVHLYARPGVLVVYPDLNDAFQLSVVAELGVRWTPDL